MSDWAHKLSSKLVRALLVILCISALFLTLCLSLSYCLYLLLTLWLAPVYAAVCTSLTLMLVLCLVLRQLGSRGKPATERPSGRKSSPSPIAVNHSDAMALALLAGYMSRSQPSTSSKLLITALDTQAATLSDENQ